MVVLLALAPTVSVGAATEQWTEVPLGATSELNAVIFAQDRFVAVGQSGTVVTSRDGTTWAARGSGLDTNLRDVAYGADRFVAVGDDGVGATSADGEQWTPTPEGGGLAVSYGNGVFIAVGSKGRIVSSADGRTWTPRESGTVRTLRGAAFSHGLFVVVGGDALPQLTGVILTSTNGLDWQVRATDLDGVLATTVHAGDRFLALGASDKSLPFLLPSNWASSTGDTWTKEEWAYGFAVPIQRAIHADGYLVGVGGASWSLSNRGAGEVLASEVGLSWTERGTSASALLGVAHGRGLFVAVGRSGEGYARRGTILTTPQVQTWTLRTNISASGIVYANDRFVAVGGNAVWRSADGRSWDLAWTQAPGLTDVTYGNGAFVAVGPTQVCTSPDGVTWSAQPSPTKLALTGIAYGNGLFVAVGGEIRAESPGGVFGPRAVVTNVIFTSTDGKVWQSQNPGVVSNVLQTVAFGGGRFVAAGYSDRLKLLGYEGEVATAVSSTDGISWAQEMGGGGVQMAYGDGRFVGVGGQFYGVRTFAATFTSTGDGSWVRRSPNVGKGLSAVGWGNGLFAAVASIDLFAYPPTAASTTSVDGLDWTVPIIWGLNGAYVTHVTFGQNTFVAVGSAVFQSNPVPAPPPTVGFTTVRIDPDGLLHLGLETAGVRVVTIETSPDLRTWSLWQVRTNQTGAIALTEPVGAPAQTKYYRARE